MDVCSLVNPVPTAAHGTATMDPLPVVQASATRTATPLDIPIPATQKAQSMVWPPYPSPSAGGPAWSGQTGHAHLGPFAGAAPSSFAAVPAQHFGPAYPLPAHYPAHYAPVSYFGYPGQVQQQPFWQPATAAVDHLKQQLLPTTFATPAWLPPSPPLEPVTADSRPSSETLPSISSTIKAADDSVAGDHDDASSSTSFPHSQHASTSSLASGASSAARDPRSPSAESSSEASESSDWAGAESAVGALDLLCETARMFDHLPSSSKQQPSSPAAPGRSPQQQQQQQQPLQQVARRGSSYKAGPAGSKHRCPQCGRGFRSSSHLSRHRKSVHSDKRDFTCRFGCGAAFNRGDNRNMHEKKCAALV